MCELLSCATTMVIGYCAVKLFGAFSKKMCNKTIRPNLKYLLKIWKEMFYRAKRRPIAVLPTDRDRKSENS